MEDEPDTLQPRQQVRTRARVEGKGRPTTATRHMRATTQTSRLPKNLQNLKHEQRVTGTLYMTKPSDCLDAKNLWWQQSKELLWEEVLAWR